MARNGSGVFAVLNPILIGALRSSSAVNQDFTDAGTEIGNTLPLDGSIAMLGGFKADQGIPTQPSISFGADRNTGFYRTDVDEFRWVSGGLDRFYVDATGKAWALFDGDVAGGLNVHGTLTGSNDVAALNALTTLGLAYRTATDTWQTDDGTHMIPAVFDAGINALVANLQFDIMIPYACTITGFAMAADVAGSCVLGIWRDTYANYPPTIADVITGSSPPTLSGAQTYRDTTLSGWTLPVNAGDTIRFNLNSVATIKRLSCFLQVKRFT